MIQTVPQLNKADDFCQTYITNDLLNEMLTHKHGKEYGHSVNVSGPCRAATRPWKQNLDILSLTYRSFIWKARKR